MQLNIVGFGIPPIPSAPPKSSKRPREQVSKPNGTRITKQRKTTDSTTTSHKLTKQPVEAKQRVQKEQKGKPSDTNETNPKRSDKIDEPTSKPEKKKIEEKKQIEDSPKTKFQTPIRKPKTHYPGKKKAIALHSLEKSKVDQVLSEKS